MIAVDREQEKNLLRENMGREGKKRAWRLCIDQIYLSCHRWGAGLVPLAGSVRCSPGTVPSWEPISAVLARG
jgi:hypothetical protein